MKQNNTSKTLHAFITKENHTLNTQEIIKITGCLSPSHLIKYLIKSRNCVFPKVRINKNTTSYTLLNHQDYSLVGEEGSL